jgi:hypothetical protein
MLLLKRGQGRIGLIELNLHLVALLRQIGHASCRQCAGPRLEIERDQAAQNPAAACGSRSV